MVFWVKFLGVWVFLAIIVAMAFGALCGADEEDE